MMNDLEKAARQALDALEDLVSTVDDDRDYMASALSAITALRAALAQQQDEPFAYCYVDTKTSADAFTFDPDPVDAVEGTVFPLYAALAQQAEPVTLNGPTTPFPIFGSATKKQAEPVVLTEVDPITGITFKATLKFDPEPVIRAIEDGESFEVLEKLAADFRKGLK